MIDIRRWILKYIFSSMVFVIFMVILSPVYVHRTVILKLTYSSAAQTSVSIECLRNKADYHRKSPVEPERFVLPQSESPNTVFLELPADNRIGGLLFSVLENASVFRFMDAAILCRGKSHPLPPDRFFVSPRDRHQVRLENGIMQIKPGRKISIPFFLSEKLKVRRSIDFVAALYMAVLSLIPALLVFRKTEITLNRRNAFDLLYVSAAVFFLIFPVLLIDYYGIFSSEQRL